MLDFKKIFDEYAAHNKRVFAHDRTQTVGASEVFDCIRKTFFKKTGAPKDVDAEDSWGAAARGDLIENYYVVPALDFALPEGLDYLYAGAHQETFIDTAAKISATPDGLVTNLPKNALIKYGITDIGTSEIVVEIKSVDPRVNLKEAKVIHRGQAIMQMGLIREQTNYKPNYAVILYFDASFLDKVTVFVIEYSEETYKNGKSRAKRVFSAENALSLPAEGKLSTSCDFCPFTSACATASKGAMPAETKTYKYGPDEQAKMAILVKEHAESAKTEKYAKENKAKLGEEIKEYLRSLQIRRMAGDKNNGDDWRVSYTFVGGKSSFDLNAMREDGIDVDAYKVDGDGHERVTITVKSDQGMVS